MATEAKERALRIAILSEFVHPFHVGGAERRYYELARRLAVRGHEVHWFAMRVWPHTVPDFEGIRLHPALEPVDVYADGGGRAIAPGLRVSLGLTRALARSATDFDVIDCSLYPFFHIFGARVVRPRTPVVVSWYEFWGEYWYEYLGWKGFFGKAVESLATRVPTRIVAVSDLATNSLLHHGVPRERVVTVPLGVDTAGIASIPPSSAASDIVFFGRLKNHKNVDLLLRAVAVVKERRPEVVCAIVGDGPERPRLEALSDSLGLHGNTRFHGAVPDHEVVALVKASRVFVHPSTKEGGGSITMMEASACGVPTVAIRHPLGLDPSLIEHGVTGWWVDDATPEGLAAGIETALAESARNSEELKSACRAFARRFDWDRIADECERLYFGLTR